MDIKMPLMLARVKKKKKENHETLWHSESNKTIQGFLLSFDHRGETEVVILVPEQLICVQNMTKIYKTQVPCT